MVPSRNAEDTVREFVTRFGDGSFAQATNLLTADGRAAVVESFPDEFQEPMDAEDALELYWLGLYAQYGDLEGVGEVEVDVDETGTNVTLEFEDGTERASIDIDDPTGITGFSFSPTYEVPEYVDRNAFSERERETVRRLAEGDYDDETIWGRPGTWHRSVGNYDPASTASSLDLPCFVLKAGRADEEIQPELAAWFHDEFEKWRAVDLADGSRVEFYEGLDHYFQKGFAPANPMSLYFGGNVAECIVSDLVGWIDDTAR